MQKIAQAHKEYGSGGNTAIDVLSMARWSKKCDVGSVLQAQQIFVPAHVGSNHWLAAIVHVRERRLEILDPAPIAATGNESAKDDNGGETSDELAEEGNSVATGDESAGGGNSAATSGPFKINAEDVPVEISWWLMFMEEQVSVEASGNTREWAIERCEYAPRQADGFNCGIYTRNVAPAQHFCGWFPT